jgi:hypothetical protein
MLIGGCRKLAQPIVEDFGRQLFYFPILQRRILFLDQAQIQDAFNVVYISGLVLCKVFGSLPIVTNHVVYAEQNKIFRTIFLAS